MGLSSGNSTFIKQIDTYTTTSAGTIVDVSTTLFNQFTLVVVKTGPVVSWNVVVEGSLDGVKFTTVIGHTDIIGDGLAMFSGMVAAPCLYFRTRCSSIVLGLGTSITATVVGTR